jgi:hypothetical protein
MKKVTLLCVALLVATSALAAPPSKIIVKYDVYGGYGQAVITALQTKWSGATITSFQGSTWPSFDSSLTSGTWDIVIVEAHNYPGTSTQYQHVADWYNKHTGPLFYADWSMNRGTSSMLVTAMGASVPTSIPMPPAAHYTWVSTHPICAGVTSWAYANPGYGIGGQRMPWTTAVPVTGWTTTQTAGQGGIMVAADKRSVISGLFISLNTSTSEAAKIWSNVLDFMWGTEGVAPTSLGKVKSLFR